jgi:4-azaleucine resistance transporter AzlC
MAGLRDQAPGVAGIVPFGLITGAAASAAGLDPALSIAMSILVFAGSAQLVAIQLMSEHAPAALIVLAALVVNLRMVMYSAAVAPYFARLSLRWKALIAYLLTDHAFALVLARFPAGDTTPHKEWYYLGAGSIMWVVWQITLVIGVFVGVQVPASWSLDFAIPLIFIALVAPALQTRAQLIAAIAAATASVFTASMPLKTGLMIAALLGVVAGMLAERRPDSGGKRRTQEAA